MSLQKIKTALEGFAASGTFDADTKLLLTTAASALTSALSQSPINGSTIASRSGLLDCDAVRYFTDQGIYGKFTKAMKANCIGSFDKQAFFSVYKFSDKDKINRAAVALNSKPFERILAKVNKKGLAVTIRYSKKTFDQFLRSNRITTTEKFVSANGWVIAVYIQNNSPDIVRFILYCPDTGANTSSAEFGLAVEYQPDTSSIANDSDADVTEIFNE